MRIPPQQRNTPHARDGFPRGLEQPEGSLRFGADALLLAAFVARHVEALDVRQPAPFVVELGCGCGAALLGLLLRCPSVRGLGLDREPPLVQAARNNAERLGLAANASFALADIADGKQLRALSELTETVHARGCGIVLANPPYDVAGRASPRSLRERALRGSADARPRGEDGQAPTCGKDPDDALSDFCRAAAMLLRHQGRFFCIYAARSLPRLCTTLDAAGLGVRRVLPIRARRSQPAMRLLVEARKNAAHDAVLEAPLTLHGAATSGGNHLWSKAALHFCPWLE